MDKILLVILVFLAFSCISHNKLLYLKKENTAALLVEKYEKAKIPEYRVQPGDRIGIEISSTVATDIEVFKQKFDEDKEKAVDPMSGYVVDNNGNINMPLIGEIQVDSLTIAEINEVVKKRLSEYVDFVHVKVRLVNYPITILGDVAAPGTRVINAENINIFEALGYAGDINETGDRRSVKIIRKSKAGTEVIKVDVSNSGIVSSDYYYLHPNDIVYVEPLKAKAFQANTRSITLVISAVTLILLFFRAV